MPPMRTSNKYSLLYLEAAQELGLATKVLDPDGLISVTSPDQTHFIYKAVTDLNTTLASVICRFKHLTLNRLRESDIPHPTQVLVTTSRSLASQLSTLTYPLVIKPDAGLAGVDVFVNLHHFSLVSKIAKSLLKKHTKIVIENFVSGVDHRFLVLDGQVIGVIQKHPPIITGDGSSSIQSLIANHPKTDLIPLDDSLRLTIAEQGLLLTDILSRGTSIAVRGNANLATGGSNQALPLTEVHPELLRLAVSAARAVHTRLAGVDILIKDPHSSSDKNAVVIEVNHNPGIWMHHYPDEGLSQPVATAILKSMFNL